MQSYKFEERLLQCLAKHLAQFPCKERIRLSRLKVNIYRLDLQPHHLTTDLLRLAPFYEFSDPRRCNTLRSLYGGSNFYVANVSLQFFLQRLCDYLRTLVIDIDGEVGFAVTRTHPDFKQEERTECL